MNILYAADDNFARQLGVSIYSLLSQHVDKKVNVYVLDSKINKKNKMIIDRLFKKDNHRIFWITSDFGLNNNISADRGSYAQFSRLFFEQVLPENIEKILYLDCDTLIVDDLSSLYQEDLTEKVALIAKDPFSVGYRKVLKIPKEADMYNSGVILFNRRKYEEGNYSQRCREIINCYGKKLIQGDQGILDVVLQNKVKIMHPRYNLISSYYEFTYSELKKYRHMTNFYLPDEIQNGLKKPVVIHFTSDFLDNRPWLVNSLHPYATQWRELEVHIFGNNRLISSKSKIKKIFNFFPRILSIPMFGLLQGYFRPFIYMIKGFKLF